MRARRRKDWGHGPFRRGAGVLVAGGRGGFFNTNQAAPCRRRETGMDLYVAPLARAIERLDEGLRRCLLDPGDGLIRDGLIQRFEFTHDLAHKALRRCLAQASGDARAVQALDVEALVEMAHDQGLLLAGWPAWRTWHDLRAHTGHTDEEPMGPEVVAAVPRFLDEVRHLQRRLAGRVV
jgi:hypothetical protein